MQIFTQRSILVIGFCKEFAWYSARNEEYERGLKERGERGSKGDD